MIKKIPGLWQGMSSSKRVVYYAEQYLLLSLELRLKEAALERIIDIIILLILQIRPIIVN